MKILEQVQTVESINRTKIDRAMQELLLYISIHGWHNLIYRINRYIFSLDDDTFRSSARKLALNRKIVLYLAQNNLTVDDLRDITFDEDRHDLIINPYYDF